MGADAIFLTAERLRREAGGDAEAPVDVAILLPRLYSAVCHLLPGLSVHTLRDWFGRHSVPPPPALVTCRDRRLRGGIVAWRGVGLLFADQDDTPAEVRFTFAHEAAHFLHEHHYPRQDLLRRFGTRIQPVIDGLRPPTREERVDALLCHADLALHTHLLDRDAGQTAPNSDLERIETEADVFACEILAPHAALLTRFPTLTLNEEAVRQVQCILIADFGLPDMPAEDYARTWVAEYGQTASLLTRLRLI